MTYSTNGQRFKAYLIDVLIILLPVLLIWGLFFDFWDVLQEYTDDPHNIEKRKKFLSIRNSA